VKPLTAPWHLWRRQTVPTTLEAFSERAKTDNYTGILWPYLAELATGLDLAVEFGTRRGTSTSALLTGAKWVISVDLQETPEARQLKTIVGDRWDYRLASSLDIDIPSCDLLFIDSLHTYKQCDGELKKHAGQVHKYLVFHDSIWRGSWGEGCHDMELTRHRDPKVREQWLGIRPAIDFLMIRDPSWFIVAHHVEACGLLVLERKP
jgi:hypothetical protein